MIDGRMNVSRGDAGTRDLAVVLVLGITAMHMPPASGLSVDHRDRSESCGARECAPNESLAGQCSSGKPAAASDVKHSGRETPGDEPCCPDDCRRCALPCCGGVTLAIARSATSPNVPAATLIAPVPSSILHAIDTADIFHPPRI